MKVSVKPITVRIYKAWLRKRLATYTRDLELIAAQRENDFQAERFLHHEISLVRSKLHSL